MSVEVAIGQPANWPEVGMHEIELPETVVGSGFFMGNWWSDRVVDRRRSERPGGNTTHQRGAGIGYPTGWQDASVVWGPTRALGIGAWLSQDPVPVRELSWGRIKSLY